MAASLAPISLVMVFRDTSPFWISIAAYLILHEPILFVEIIAMIICFSMVIVIAFQRKSPEIDEDKESIETEEGGSNTMLGLSFGLIAAGCMAGLAVSTRSLKDISTSIILFWYCVGGIIMTGLYLIGEIIIIAELPGRFSSYSGKAWMFASGSACFDAASLCLITVAY